MERRAASHTEEEEMNQRRKLLNAARRGDTKAISKLFELYQVRVLSGEQLAKVNRTSAYMVPATPAKRGKSASPKPTKGAKQETAKPVKPEPKRRAKEAAKPSAGKPPKSSAVRKRTVKHK